MLCRMMLLDLLDLILQELVIIHLLRGGLWHSILSLLGVLNQLRRHLIV